jgi:hypothetical protein
MRLRIGDIPRVRLKDARMLRDELLERSDFRNLNLMAYVTLINGSFGVVIRHPVGLDMSRYGISRRTDLNGVPIKIEERPVNRPTR